MILNLVSSYFIAEETGTETFNSLPSNTSLLIDRAETEPGAPQIPYSFLTSWKITQGSVLITIFTMPGPQGCCLWLTRPGEWAVSIWCCEGAALPAFIRSALREGASSTDVGTCAALTRVWLFSQHLGSFLNLSRLSAPGHLSAGTQFGLTLLCVSTCNSLSVFCHHTYGLRTTEGGLCVCVSWSLLSGDF